LLAIFVITGVGILNIEPNKGVPLKEKADAVKVVDTGKGYQENFFSEDVIKSNVAYIISGTNVRVRQRPSFKSEIKNLLPIGKEIRLIDETGSWVSIIYMDSAKIIDGWVHRDFIATVK